MIERLSRRALLASVGSTLFAGCQAQTDASESRSTREPTPTETGELSRSPPNADESAEPTSTATPLGTTEPPDRIESAWPMPAFGPGRSNYAPNATGPSGSVAEVWNVTTETAPTGLVLADERLVVADVDGVVRALNARTGDELWRESVGDATETPRIVDGRVLAPTESDIVALAATDGTELWRAPTPAREDLVAASHGVYWLGRHIETGDGTQHAVGLVKVDANDGSERWRTPLSEPWQPRVFASDETVFVSTGVHADSPWRIDPASGSVVGDVPVRESGATAERFVLDWVVYAVSGFWGQVSALAYESDVSGWLAERDGWPTDGYELSGGGEHVFFAPANTEHADAPGLYALSRGDGSVDWTADLPRGRTGRPVATDERVMVSAGDRIRSFDAADGREEWSIPRGTVGSEFIVADDVLFGTVGTTVRAVRSRQ